MLEAGTRLGPGQLGLLAAVGRDRVLVRPRPRVVIISTGSELVEPGAPTEPGQIYESNTYLLTTAAREAGALAYRVGIVPDDDRSLMNAIEDQLIRADLVLTSGGVSVGAYDVVKEVLSRLGTVRFDRVAMQPGKPQGFGTVGPDSTPIITLPGNPVSSYVSFEVFVRPVIRRMLGVEPLHRPVVRASCLEPLTSQRGKRQFLRGLARRGRRAVRRPAGRRPRLAPGPRAGARQRADRGPRGRHRGAGGRRGRGHGARAAAVMSTRCTTAALGLAMTEPRLTHVDEAGAARMVDVSGKDVTVRTATATGRVLVSPEVVALLREGGVPKGDALAVARIAGIQAAKRTPDLVPLCHPIAIHGVDVDLAVADDAVHISATVRTADRTGVEMEALTCVAVAGLALVDMVKAVDRAATITDVRVEQRAAAGRGSGGAARRRTSPRRSHEGAGRQRLQPGRGRGLRGPRRPGPRRGPARPGLRGRRARGGAGRRPGGGGPARGGRLGVRRRRSPPAAPGSRPPTARPR